MNQVMAGLVGTIIGWTGFIVLVLILRQYAVLAFSEAAVWLINNTENGLQARIIKHLVNRETTVDQLYEELKREREKDDDKKK